MPSSLPVATIEPGIRPMLNGLYSAGTAMEGASRRHELIAQNLAHAQMPGYRRQSMTQTSIESNFADELKNAVNYESLGVKTDGVNTDFSPGILERTNHPLDMAIQGDGFFVVEGPNGPLYTRNGAFQLDQDGRLVTTDQLPVQGGSGEITLPPDAALSELKVTTDGTIFSGDQEVGKLKIVNFGNPQQLEQTGITLFSAPDGVMPMEASGIIMQNMREHSNVSPIQELVELIAAQRQQEAAQRSMTALSESISKNINLQGR